MKEVPEEAFGFLEAGDGKAEKLLASAEVPGDGTGDKETSVGDKEGLLVVYCFLFNLFIGNVLYSKGQGAVRLPYVSNLMQSDCTSIVYGLQRY
jgi:hypothetical protein